MAISKSTITICIAFILPLVEALSHDYINNHTLQCTQLSSDANKLQSNLSQLWQVLIIHRVDRISFLVICPIILLIQTALLATYKRNPQLRNKPGNIFCGLVFIQMGLNLHIFCNTVYRTINSYNQPMPDSFIGFCLSMCIIYSFFSLLHFMYLVMFMFYTIFIFRFSLKKKSQKFWTTLHIFVIATSIGLTFFFYFFDFMGLTFYGLCGLTPTRRLEWNPILPSMEIICSIVFTILGIFTYVYFIKHMPGGQGFKRRKIQEGKIIFLYVTVFSIFQILMSASSLILDINCTQDTPLPQINVLVSIVNLTRLVEFAFLIFLILLNQNFRNKLKLTIKGIFQNKKQNLNQQSSLFSNVQMEDILFNEQLLQMKQRTNEIDLLRLSQIYTIISGIYVAYYEYFRDFTENEKNLNLRRINFRDSIMFNLNHKTIIDYQTQARHMLKLRVLPCTVIIHSPKIFHRILDMDGLQNIFQSFHIVDNSKKLSNLAQGKGGKSGQFFFFSSDNKYVIKTVSEEQFQFYSENLQQFYYYFKQNPQSLLAKILGLFTIKGDQMQKKYQLILMKNILGCEKNQIIRLYDLKGSKYDRQVLFQQIQANQISKLTLKDIDFINYEGKLNIRYQYAKLLRQNLKKDTLFLKNLGLLDFSLLIVKVKWQTQPQQQQFWGQLQRIPHDYQTKQFYHIGLIDYLQKWDLQKRSEKWWKKLTGKKDISAEQPKRYQMRFMEFIDQITSQSSKQGSRMPQISAIQLKNVKGDRSVTEPKQQSQKGKQTQLLTEQDRFTDRI